MKLFIFSVFLFAITTARSQVKPIDTSNYNHLRSLIKDQGFFIKQDSSNAVAFVKRADCKLQLKDYYGAINDYSAAIKLKADLSSEFNNRGYAYYNRAMAEYGLNDFKAASSDLTKTLDFVKDNAGVYYFLGLIKSNLKDYTNAVQYYNNAILLNPQLKDAYYRRGVAVFELGKYKEAMSDFDAALKIGDMAEAYYCRALVKCKFSDFTGAIKDDSKAIELMPAYYDAFNNKGTAEMQSGQYESALEDFNKALQLNPTSYDAYNNRGSVKFLLKDPQGAILDLTKAIELGPQYYDAYYNRSLIYKNTGEKKKSKKDFNQAEFLRSKQQP